MFAIQNVARRAPQLSKLVVNQHRTLTSLPPREKVSLVELLAHGSLLWLGIMGIPMYIGCNVLKYNEGKED
ncbi:uncharacterized protein LOC143220583 [Lasioglossum baleicum]|uniref:uncharacterized protein LOC143220583 n=1 Tax=Lasioglossum baleicum TaxID=434251 RepID=UPI003FCCA96C